MKHPSSQDPNADMEPLSDELLAMAYADGELTPEQRKSFEARLITETKLAEQLEEMRGLTLVARNLIPPEPEDREWRRISRDPLQSGGLRFAWLLCLLALLAMGAGLAVSIGDDGTHWTWKAGLILGGLGLSLLLLLALRERLAVLPHDPYRKLMR